MQKYMHYILGMHFPKYHDLLNQRQYLVRQSLELLDLLRRNNDQMQMSLVVFCNEIKKKTENMIKAYLYNFPKSINKFPL